MRIWSPQHIERKRLERLGTTFSDETKKRMSEAHLGIKQTDESKKKISDTMKLFHQNKKNLAKENNDNK